MTCSSQLSSQLLKFSSSHKTKAKVQHKSCHVIPRMSLYQQRQTSSSSLSSLSPTILLTSITKLLWGPSLHPELLISSVRTAWSSTWQFVMSQLALSDPSSNYTRPAYKFSLKKNTPSSSNLHLYVGLPYSWAHRTTMWECHCPNVMRCGRKDVRCKESYGKIQYFNSGLNGLTRNPDLHLSLVEFKGKIGEWNKVI